MKPGVSAVPRDNMPIMEERGNKSGYHFILSRAKRKNGKKQPSNSGTNWVALIVCVAAVAQSSRGILLGVLKCIRSLLGLNDNRNHPNLEGNYLSGDLLQSGECFFRIFFFFFYSD